MASRIRALSKPQQLRLIITVCNRLKTTPDAKVPVHLRRVLRLFKSFVTTCLARHNTRIKTAHEANGLVVLLTDRPSPSNLPSSGLWVGFATSRDGVLHCPAQSYVYIKDTRVGMIHTAEKITMHGSCNRSIAREEAQLLLHLSQSRA